MEKSNFQLDINLDRFSRNKSSHPFKKTRSCIDSSHYSTPSDALPILRINNSDFK